MNLISHKLIYTELRLVIYFIRPSAIMKYKKCDHFLCATSYIDQQVA